MIINFKKENVLLKRASISVINSIFLKTIYTKNNDRQWRIINF